MKIVIFGIGKVFCKVKQFFNIERAEIVALVDNNRKLCGTLVDGYMVDVPENIRQYQYDYIIITSAYAVEMRQELIRLGIRPEKVIHYQDYIGSLPIEVSIAPTDVSIPNVLILSNDFGYHGGAVACMNLAHVLRQAGYGITIAVPSAENKLLEEVSSEKGIKVIVVKNLEFMSRENLEWTSGYTYVLANTIVMARCAIKLAQKRSVYLWLHESVDSYVAYEYWYDEIEDGIKNNQLMIGAVSDVARKNFLSIFQVEKEIGLLPYGIDDRYKRNNLCPANEVTTFTVVAYHTILKGLDVLLDALNYISEGTRTQCRFFFVGKAIDNEYGKSIRNRIEENINCEYLGELPREKLFELYSKTDIVIVPSRRDSLPLVATEAMMLKKPCIISDATGTAAYIRHQYNGLIFKNGDSEELAKVICWCLKNKEAINMLAENARKTYEKWFTMEKFGNRVMEVFELIRSQDGKEGHYETRYYFR